MPSSASEQARYLRDLNRNNPEAVVRLYEQGKVAASEGNLAEYLKVRARGRPTSRPGADVKISSLAE